MRLRRYHLECGFGEVYPGLWDGRNRWNGWALITRATAALGAPESPHDCAECGRATLVPCADCAALEDAWAECPLDYNWYDYAPVKVGDIVVCFECSRR